MPRVVRRITYQSENLATLQKQIQMSLAEGVHELAVQIEVETMEDNHNFTAASDGWFEKEPA